ncbi:MAG: ABC transporter permease [Candidatus Faecousia sp.]|nr:ABC transporter permease [Candidatus Faecousia sp.]
MIRAFRMALRSISSNKMRAALTMLGIIIGVMALVVLVSLVNGATNSVTSAVSGLGNSQITVTIRDDKGSPLTLQELEGWLEESPLLAAVAPYKSESVVAKRGGENSTLTVYGTTPAYYEIQGLQLAMGRFLKRADVENSSYVCVLNEDAAEELVGYIDCVGQSICLNGVEYTIVGVLASNDDNLTSVLTSGMQVAYLPLTSLVKLTDTVSREITTFYAAPQANVDIQLAADSLETLLMDRFQQDEDAYRLSSQSVVEDVMNQITSMLTILLGGIAAISLVVGGIGIMNIMLVTVTERTREIGIRKAIGASRGTILSQFLMEAVVLCMLGCGLGIFLSWAVLQLISTVVASMDIRFTLNMGVVLLSVVFCFLIGVIFGLYPANKAAKMKPIDALHYGG